MAIVTALGKESFARRLPGRAERRLIAGTRPSDGIPGNADDAKYMADWLAMAKGRTPTVTGPLGGVDHVTPGNNNGYNAYMSMMALVLAMRKANFTGKADTDKLVAAFETLNVPQGPDFPDGPLIMNKDDHQGRTTYYLLKINGQKEDVVQTFPADSLPMIGDCKIQAKLSRSSRVTSRGVSFVTCDSRPLTPSPRPPSGTALPGSSASG